MPPSRGSAGVAASRDELTDECAASISSSSAAGRGPAGAAFGSEAPLDEFRGTLDERRAASPAVRPLGPETAGSSFASNACQAAEECGPARHLEGSRAAFAPGRSCTPTLTSGSASCEEVEEVIGTDVDVHRGGCPSPAPPLPVPERTPPPCPPVAEFDRGMRAYGVSTVRLLVASPPSPASVDPPSITEPPSPPVAVALAGPSANVTSVIAIASPPLPPALPPEPSPPAASVGGCGGSKCDEARGTDCVGRRARAATVSPHAARSCDSVRCRRASRAAAAAHAARGARDSTRECGVRRSARYRAGVPSTPARASISTIRPGRKTAPAVTARTAIPADRRRIVRRDLHSSPSRSRPGRSVRPGRPGRDLRRHRRRHRLRQRR